MSIQSYVINSSYLKQISATTTYASVRDLIQQIFVENEQSIIHEKVIQLCLRKLSDWYKTSNNIKQIKTDFYQYFLNNIRLTQKQIIDLLLSELNTNNTDKSNRDYLLYLLTEIYDKNYLKFLYEQFDQRENGIQYIVHLPDKIVNVCTYNIPPCFQTKTYFNRLSLFIKNELETKHYTNMEANRDTNIDILCKLVIKSSKLGNRSCHESEWDKNCLIRKKVFIPFPSFERSKTFIP
ncbi:unnamed protein product [Didymodactylos carnosus]|uniref:Uncharacterized protein n=1 Tax=Didymodactylos carnosus TaxID=1234261 RepID=A0A813SZF0_9BILA|nr:unnamed protein product [Didymodactylos carnosus]CAF1380153.1 unnamed protein product [Didymodactylos carnosus]CAF3585909.1 unnamed protein product [Didymodactylos carnosus]CAF4188571.1 unnamed protein product [Didymodactylos carnosus]